MIKKISVTLFVLSLSFGNALAGVRHIATDSSNSDSGSYRSSIYQYNDVQEQEDPATTCQSAGYSKHGCPSGYRPIGECPYDSNYYAGCCLPQYQYSKQDCFNAQMKPSSDNCMGYYACE